MRARIASDIHAEFYGQEGWDQIMASFPGDEADVLILAGDVASLRFRDQALAVLRPFCERYKHVVYVPGNHEYYDSVAAEAHLVLLSVAGELPNLILLNNDEREVGGVRFFGGTMWFPDLPNNWRWKSGLNDFTYIKKFQPWVYEQNGAFHEAYGRIVSPEHVVVSHHLPSMRSVPERYRAAGGDSINVFFVDLRMEARLARIQPRLWIHGHTHTACDWRAGDARVVCAPYGYPYEMARLPEPVVIDL